MHSLLFPRCTLLTLCTNMMPLLFGMPFWLGSKRISFVTLVLIILVDFKKKTFLQRDWFRWRNSISLRMNNLMRPPSKIAKPLKVKQLVRKKLLHLEWTYIRWSSLVNNNNSNHNHNNIWASTWSNQSSSGSYLNLNLNSVMMKFPSLLAILALTRRTQIFGPHMKDIDVQLSQTW